MCIIEYGLVILIGFLIYLILYLCMHSIVVDQKPRIHPYFYFQCLFVNVCPTSSYICDAQKYKPQILKLTT